MGQIMMVTGGAKSGKSVFAENQFQVTENMCYIATGVMKFNDEEMKLRIKTHQQRRPQTWGTEERYELVGNFITQSNYDSYLLDDATMLNTNLFYDLVKEVLQLTDEQLDERIEMMTKVQIEMIQKRILAEWQAILKSARKKQVKLVVVTNEVGLGVVPANKQTRILRDIYGEVNQLIAKAADTVYLVVSGLEMKLK